MEIHNSIQKNEQPQIKGEIILYQPTEDIRIEARIVYETIWLTQQQISMLFGTKRPAITKHISNIYSSGELDKESTCSILEHMGNEERQRYATMYYNLDIILAVGYRVNSFNATQFRKWATKVLKDYLIKGYSVNNRLERLEQRVTKTEEKIDFFVRTALPPVEGVFYNGQIFDSRTTLLDIEKYNAQYTPIEIKNSDFIHDRFLIIDKEVYHIGASLKDLGKKLFAFSKMNISAEMILQMTELEEFINRKHLK